jgi:hypothetical protein
MLGPAYAPRRLAEVYIDNAVLEDDQVAAKADILRQGEEEIARRLREMGAS